MSKQCPFKVGNKVRFEVKNINLANSTAKPALKPGTVGRVTAIHEHKYLQINGVSEWWHWNLFTKV